MPARSVALVVAIRVLDVVEADRGVADRVPGIPGDLEDHDRDRKTDFTERRIERPTSPCEWSCP